MGGGAGGSVRWAGVAASIGVKETSAAMKKSGKFRVFTLYFQESTADERWIAVLGDILCLAGRFSDVDWRRKCDRDATRVFLGIYKSGIYIDTVEEPRVAVFLRDSVEVETCGRNGKSRVRRVKSWGNGGKTPAQLKRKVVGMLVQVLELLDRFFDPGPEYRIEREDVMGLLGFIAFHEPRYIEGNS